MNHDLQRSLDENAQQWPALSHSISAAEPVAFDKIHDGFFAADPVRLVELFELANREGLEVHPDALRRPRRALHSARVPGHVRAGASEHDRCRTRQAPGCFPGVVGAGQQRAARYSALLSRGRFRRRAAVRQQAGRAPTRRTRAGPGRHRPRPDSGAAR